MNAEDDEDRQRDRSAGACVGAPGGTCPGTPRPSRRGGRTSRRSRSRRALGRRRSCPIRQLLAEEAGRLEDEDGDQDAEDDRFVQFAEK